MAKQYSKQEILDFLRTVNIMSASINTESYPISTILLFSVDDDFTFYFATREDTFKAAALRKSPKISVSVWEHNKMLVQAHGGVSEVADSQEIDEILDKLSASVATLYDFWPPILRVTGGNYRVYKAKMNWVRALDLISKMIKEEDMTFTEYNL